MAAADGIHVYEQSRQPLTTPNVEEYIYLVKRIAQHIMVRMPASVQIDDLTQAGMIGLLEASKKYDASQGASFETYAGIRIRGAMIDEMRKGDWVPRSVHRNARRISDVMTDLEGRLGRDVTSAEVAEAMDISLDEYHAMSQDVMCGRLFSVDEPLDDEQAPVNLPDASAAFINPDDSTHKIALKKALVEAIKQLPEREGLVLSLYYDEELNLKEIGQVMGVSESRVSQIHSQAALRLRSKLRGWL